MANNLEGMDNLVGKLFESYNLPSDKLEEIKSNLVNKITEYLDGELSKLNFDSNVVVESVEDIDASHIRKLLECNETVSLNLNESNLIIISKKDDILEYTLGESVDIDKIDEEILIESWNTNSLDIIENLVNSIKSSLAEVI